MTNEKTFKGYSRFLTLIEKFYWTLKLSAVKQRQNRLTSSPFDFFFFPIQSTMNASNFGPQSKPWSFSCKIRSIFGWIK